MSDLFLIGLFAGISLMVLYGALEGLFGEWTTLAILLLACIAVVVEVSLVGPTEAASELSPWPYWLGVLVGSVIGFLPSRVIQETLEDSQGRPLAARFVGEWSR